MKVKSKKLCAYNPDLNCNILNYCDLSDHLLSQIQEKNRREEKTDEMSAINPLDNTIEEAKVPKNRYSSSEEKHSSEEKACSKISEVTKHILDDNSLVNFDTSEHSTNNKIGNQIKKTLQAKAEIKYEENSTKYTEILKQLHKEEENSIKKATMHILKDSIYTDLTVEEKAHKISDTILALQEQFSSVRLLIMKNHDTDYNLDQE